jgi:hypothetical protein
VSLGQELLSLVTQLVDQVPVDLADVAWLMEEVDGME